MKDSAKILRTKRALVAGRAKTATEITRELTEQRRKYEQLADLHYREGELQERQKSLLNSSSHSTAAGLSAKNHIARRQLQESVAQLALLDVLCHLDRINQFRIKETSSELERCSAELDRLNRAREIFHARVGRIQATEQLVVELAE